MNNLTAVSYTHLDVYKRQVYPLLRIRDSHRLGGDGSVPGFDPESRVERNGIDQLLLRDILEHSGAVSYTHLVKLNVEKYGGMLCAPWFDRPLSVAGRIIVKDGNRLTTKLINVDRDLLMIPNLSLIHI